MLLHTRNTALCCTVQLPAGKYVTARQPAWLRAHNLLDSGLLLAGTRPAWLCHRPGWAPHSTRQHAPMTQCRLASLLAIGLATGVYGCGGDGLVLPEHQ